MPGTFYKAFGFLVWKGGMRYLRHRYGSPSGVSGGGLARRLRGGALAAGALAGAAALVARRNGRAG